jgi:ubiquinone/menaquinone biosynthesis C-methylase UbiE
LFGKIEWMVHRDHVNLIKNALAPGGVWADFGSGDGAFTLALADVAGKDAEIYSVDKDQGRLQNQKRNFEEMFPNWHIRFLHADFTKPLDLPQLDGVLMANSLHYVKEQVPFLQFIRGYLKPSGKVIVVEYNTDSGNTWVPYPLSFRTFQKIAHDAGFSRSEQVSSIASSFLEEIYSAQAS